MKAVLLDTYDAPFVVADVDLDTPADDEVEVRTVAAGVCHTDRTVRTGAHRTPTPSIMGHEAAGVVTAVGVGVRDLEVGDHVVACPSSFCGTCEWCLRGLSHLCTDKGHKRLPGRPARATWNGADVLAHSGVGGYGERMLLHERAAVAVPAEVPLDLAALLGCAVLTGVGSVVNMAQVRPGQTVAVIGIGGVGLNVVQGARISGAARIIAIDRVPAKLERARAFGATDVVDGTGVDIADAVRELTGGGVDHAFEVVGRGETIEAAFGMLRPRGTATVVGVPRPDTRLSLSPMGLFGERRLQGATMGASTARLLIPMLARLYLDGRLLLDELVSERIGLDDVNAALDHLDDSSGARSVVVFG